MPSRFRFWSYEPRSWRAGDLVCDVFREVHARYGENVTVVLAGPGHHSRAVAKGFKWKVVDYSGEDLEAGLMIAFGNGVTPVAADRIVRIHIRSTYPYIWDIPLAGSAKIWKGAP